MAVFNLGAQIGDRSLSSTTLKQFEMGWHMATFGLFRLAQVLLPYMAQRGKGTLLRTSATAAMRGNAGLVARTEASVTRGAFGAPTFFVGEQMFFDQDRLDIVREALLARSSLQRGEPLPRRLHEAIKR